MGLPRPWRLTRRGEFDAVRRRGKSLAASRLVLSYWQDESLPGDPKVGLIVPKGAGGAITRNLTKRRLRELLRHSFSDLPRHCHVVVIARRQAENATWDGLEKDWRWLVRKTGLIAAPKLLGKPSEGRAGASASQSRRSAAPSGAAATPKLPAGE